MGCSMTTKQYLIDASLLVLIAVLLGCQNAPAPERGPQIGMRPEEEFVKYTVSRTGISFSYPSTWERIISNDAVVLISPLEGPTDRFSEDLVLVIQELQGEWTTEDYMEGSIEGFEAVFDDFSQVARVSGESKNLQYQSLIYTYTFNGLPLKVLFRVYVINGVGYAFTFSATPSSFDDYLPTVTTLLDSVVIEDIS